MLILSSFTTPITIIPHPQPQIRQLRFGWKPTNKLVLYNGLLINQQFYLVLSFYLWLGEDWDWGISIDSCCRLISRWWKSGLLTTIAAAAAQQVDNGGHEALFAPLWGCCCWSLNPRQKAFSILQQDDDPSSSGLGNQAAAKSKQLHIKNASMREKELTSNHHTLLKTREFIHSFWDKK